MRKPFGHNLKSSTHQQLLSQVRNPEHTQTYRLRRYLWRGILSVIGPCALLGLYTFISLHFLNRQPQNEILIPDTFDATIVFYTWFLAAVFTLEWARPVLGNFQAAVLMFPAFAPTTAMTLFWHADDNWANPLWWLRALRNALIKPVSSKSKWLHLPGLLWTLLSIDSILIFAAVPLSGLTMETVAVSSVSTNKATIRGPDPSIFGRKSANALPSIIDGT